MSVPSQPTHPRPSSWLRAALVSGLALLPAFFPVAATAAERARDWGGADAPYLKQLHDLVHPRWSAFLMELSRIDKSYQDPTLSTEVVVVIDGRGVLQRVDYTRHAALKGFDDAPADLFKDVGLLPAPPLELQSDDGNVYVRWRFQRRAPGCEEKSIIERRLPVGEAVPRLVQSGRAGDAARRIRDEAPAAARPALLRSFVEQLGRTAAVARDPLERELAAAILALLPDGESSLLGLLGDKVPSVRLRALEALSGQLLSPAVAPALRKLLDSEDRAIAALLLARLKDRSAVPVLREALLAGQRPAETAAALRSLDDGAEAGRIVARMLEMPDRSQAGAVAARALGDPAHTPLLLKQLGSGPEAMRLAVLDALGAMGARAPLEARKAVLRAMGDMAPKVRARAMRACAGLGDKSVGLRYRLIDSLPDPDPLVRAAAAAALVEVGGEVAKDELLRMVKDPSVTVRAALLQAAMAHPFPSASTLISRLRKEPEVEEAARQPAPREDGLLPDEVPAEAGPRHRAPLLTSRQVTLPAGADEEERLTQRLLGATTAQERLRAAAGWLALQRP